MPAAARNSPTSTGSGAPRSRCTAAVRRWRRAGGAGRPGPRAARRSPDRRWPARPDWPLAVDPVVRLHLASRPMRPGCCTDPPRIPFTRWVRKSGTATMACGRTSRMLSAQRSTRDSAKATVAPFTNASSSATRSSMWLRGRMESTTSPACKRQLVAGGVDVVQHVAVSQDRTAGHALLVDRLHDGRHVGPIELIHLCLPCLRAEDPGQHRLAAGRGA